MTESNVHMPLGIAMLASVFPPSVGGIQTHTLRLSARLARLGHRVMVVTRKHRGLADEEMVEGVRVLRVGAGDARRGVATLSYVAASLKTLLERRSEFTVLHAHQMLSPMTVGLLARSLPGKRLVVNPHACGPLGDVGQLRGQGRLGALRMKAAVHRADAFVAISGIIRDELKSIGVDDRRIWSVPNGVELELFRPASKTEKAAIRKRLGLGPGPWVVSAGRLEPEKGVDVLLKAWAEVAKAHRTAKLLIVGDGSLRSILPKSDERIRVVGAQKDVASFLRASDAFCLPSRTEGLPVALLEAMACGLPSAATAVGGTPEVLQDGVTGRLSPAENPDALAQAICEALKSPAWGRNARIHAASHYALDRIAEETSRLYQSLHIGAV